MPTSASIASSTRFAWKQPSGKLPLHCATFKMEYSAWYRQASIPEATNTAEFAGSMRHTPKSCVQRECLRVSFKIRAVNPSELLVAGCLRQRMDGRRVGDRIRVHPGLKQQKRTAEFSADVSCHAVSCWASCICDSHRFACRWPSLMCHVRHHWFFLEFPRQCPRQRLPDGRTKERPLPICENFCPNPTFASLPGSETFLLNPASLFERLRWQKSEL